MTVPHVVERSATRDGLQAVVDLYREYEAEVRGAPDTDPSDVLREWDEPGFDLARVVEQFTRWDRPAAD